MLPSKAERILSRYRPIAPKPLPLPPSGSFGTTDPSSTCASLDSFTSSGKCKKSRKRKAEDAVSAKGLKAPKPIGSGLSNTGGASSLTQGFSDGTVPLGDLRSVSQISYGSMPFGMEEGTEMSNGATVEARGTAAEVRFTSYNGAGAPMYVADAGNIQGLYMPPETTAQHRHQFALMHHRLGPGCNPSPVNVMERDAGFMERAAAASASVMPERSPVCDVGCVKGVGYVGGGFTEMIRGITRLPTAADVQTLMQARAFPSPVVGQAAAVGAWGSGGLRGSPTSSREMPQRRLDPPPLSNHNWSTISPSQAEVDQVCETDTDLVTLSLLPNIPSKMCSSVMASLQAGSPPSSHNPHNLESSWHHQVPSRVEPLARSEPPAVISNKSVGLSQTGAQVASGCPHNLESSWHHQGPSRVEPLARSEPPAVISNGSVGLSQTGAQLASECPLLSAAPNKAPSGLVVPSVSLPVMQVAASPVMADGAVVDEGYLEQVYGGSTDPVLLVDDNNRVLWFNKPYDRALKFASERLSGKTIPTGPYIDPLGHPTPLGCFVFPVYGKSARATLWGFLKKLVIQESELPLEQGAPSQLRLTVGEVSKRMSPLLVNRMRPVICSSNARVTTVTVESITEVHMDAPATTECVEAAEIRLGAGSEPAFITDCLYRVRWVNAALKQMLGHMSFDGLSKHTNSKGADGPSEAPTFVVCCTDKVPRSAWAFSCRVNLEWVKGGRRRSMMVPCDVSRLACNTRVPEVHWVWQFDMAVSLCLNAPS